MRSDEYCLPEIAEDSDTSDSDFEEVENKDGFEAFSKSAPVKPSHNNESVPGPSRGSNLPKSISSKKDWNLVSEENHEQVISADFIMLCPVVLM